MNKYSKYWGEAVAVASAVLYFLTPSLQAFAAAHPTGKIASVIAIILALGLKKSPLQS